MENQKAFTIIFLTVFIDLLGFGLIIPILPNYIKELGASNLQYGLIASVFSLLNFIFTPFLGSYSDRLGRRPIILLSIAMNFIGYMIFSHAAALPIFILSRIFCGIGSSNISAAQAYIADISSPENRTKMMGMIGAAFGLGFIFGPLFGGLLKISFGIEGLGYSAAGLCGLNFLLAFFLLPESNKNLNANAPIRFVPVREYVAAFKKPILRELMWLWVFYVGAFAMMQTVSALLWKEKYGMDERHIGYLFGLIGVFSVIVQAGLVGRLNKMYGEKRLLVYGSTMMIFGLGMIPLIPQAFFWTGSIISIAFITLGNGCLGPSLQALVSKITPPDEQGRMLGLNQSVGSIARILGPMLSGLFYGFYDALPFFVGGAMMGVCVLISNLVISAVNKREVSGAASIS